MHRLLGFLDGKSHHGARRVQHEDQFFRRHLGRRGTRGWLQQKSKEASTGIAVRQYGILDAPPGGTVTQNKILVRNRGLLFEAHDDLPRARPFRRDFMCGRVNRINRHARIDLHLNGDVVTGSRTFGRDRRRNTGRVQHTFVPGDVARTDHHGKNEFVSARFVRQRFHVPDRDLHLRAGSDIRHSLRKNVGTLLIEEGSGLAGAAGFLVDRARFAALFNRAADGAIPNRHGHLVYRRVGRQRKYVYRLDIVRKRIFEFLRDADA